jgi:hypothetical protein
MDMRFGMWNVRSLYRSGSLKTVSGLQNEELHGFYSSPSFVRVIKARRKTWAGHVACMGEVRGAYNILVGGPEGRSPLGRPRRR